jgi:hypothetical protein
MIIIALVKYIGDKLRGQVLSENMVIEKEKGGR